MLKEISVLLAGICWSQTLLAAGADRLAWICYKKNSNVVVTAMIAGQNQKMALSQMIYVIQEKSLSTGLTEGHYFIDPLQHFGDDQHHHVTAGSSTQGRQFDLIVGDFKVESNQRTGIGNLSLTVPEIENGKISLKTTRFKNLNCTLQKDE